MYRIEVIKENSSGNFSYAIKNTSGRRKDTYIDLTNNIHQWDQNSDFWTDCLSDDLDFLKRYADMMKIELASSILYPTSELEYKMAIKEMDNINYNELFEV
jgi:hypothetical protein